MSHEPPRPNRSPLGPIGLAAAIACALLMLAPTDAHAYVDPGSGSAIVTAILGAIGAVGYMLRKFFYRVVKKLFRSETPGDDE